MKSIEMKQRVIWGMNPVTRTIPNKKNYRRAKSKTYVRDEIITNQR
jgi:hypothetical protein